MHFTVVASLALTTAFSLTFARKYYVDRAEIRLQPINRERYRDQNLVLPADGSARIVMFGDSRIEQWEPRFAMPQMGIVWRGISGETTAQMLERYRDDVIALHPEAVVLQAGINDLVCGEATGRAGLAVRIAATNLRSMAELALRSGIRPVVMTVVRPRAPPLWRRPVMSGRIFASVADLNTRIRALEGSGITVIDLDTALAGADSSTPLHARFGVDTLHWSGAAYGVANELTLAALRARKDAVQ